MEGGTGHVLRPAFYLLSEIPEDVPGFVPLAKNPCKEPGNLQA